MDFVMNCLQEISSLTDELDFALDNLCMVHHAMEEDGGANWQVSNNAVFFVYLMTCDIVKRLNEITEQALAKRANEE